MGSVRRLIATLLVLLSRLVAPFHNSHTLHRAKFASLHEITSLLGEALAETSLLLGIGHLSQVLQVRATPHRRELVPCP